MTSPEDRQRWDQPHGQSVPTPPDGAAPQEPTTGGIVSYNASAFDEDRPEAASAAQSSPQPPTSGGFPVPEAGGPPSGEFGTGQYGASPYNAPTYGVDSYGPAPHATGAYGAHPYAGGQNGAAYGADQYGTAGQPTSGGIPVPPGYGGPHPSSPYGPGTPTKPRSPKPVLLALGGLLLVGALVAGYFVFFTFGGIQNSEGEIKNAASFLTQTESSWKGELPSDGIEVSPKAACYYVLNDRDDITNQIACGPSRRASTPKGAVWDMYHFSVTGSGDSQQAADAKATETSQAAPTSGSLVTVDGDEPADDGLALKEPPLPKAPSQAIYQQGSYEVGDKSAGEVVQFTGSPSLIAPSAQVTLVSKQEATSATIDGKLMAPAEGEKFFVITVKGESGPVGESASNSLLFNFDGTSLDASADPSGLGETTFLVSWPDGAKASMELKSSGHVQSLSLDDGARAEDKTTQMYYAGSASIETPLSTVVTMPDTPSSAGPVFNLNITFTQGKLAPYLSDQGWAPEGQVWLVLNFQDSATVVTPDSGYSKYKFDCKTSAVEGGSMFECGPDGPSVGRLIADVPADQRSFNLNLAMKLSITGDGVPDATVDFAPVATQIAFG